MSTRHIATCCHRSPVRAMTINTSRVPLLHQHHIWFRGRGKVTTCAYIAVIPLSFAACFVVRMFVPSAAVNAKIVVLSFASFRNADVIVIIRLPPCHLILVLLACLPLAVSRNLTHLATHSDPLTDRLNNRQRKPGHATRSRLLQFIHRPTAEDGRSVALLAILP